jgi:hypothetical protein
VNSIRDVSEDDLDRLPAFDPPNLSFDPCFRVDYRQRQRYQRFRHMGTTYFGNGTSFVLLTDAVSPWDSLLLHHLQRHYTNLCLIAQYQHAALLHFADALAEVAKELAGDARENRERLWRDRIRQVQHRFLKFRTRAYFTEVSNQIQGKELFRFWFERLGTAELFQRVAASSADVYQALEDYEAKELAERQTRLAEVQTKLAIVAQWGFALTVGISIWALVLQWVSLFPDEIRSAPVVPPHMLYVWPWVWLVIGCLLGTCVGTMAWFWFTSKAKVGSHHVS